MNTKLSTDELFHFTRFENLINIIKEGFYSRYNLEHTYLSNLFERPSAITSIPMVCFCDIPLTMVHEHSSKYGKCAIGLDKKWGEKYGLSPVIYVHKNSRIGDAFSALSNTIANHLPTIQNNTDVNMAMMVSTLAIGLGQLSYYLKQYERIEDEHYYVNQNRFTFKKGRFYDEREWRFVPMDDSEDGIWLINAETLLNKEELEKAHEKLKKHALKFEINDIKYIVTETEEQKQILLNLISEKYQVATDLIANKIMFTQVELP